MINDCRSQYHRSSQPTRTGYTVHAVTNKRLALVGGGVEIQSKNKANRRRSLVFCWPLLPAKGHVANYDQASTRLSLQRMCYQALPEASTPLNTTPSFGMSCAIHKPNFVNALTNTHCLHQRFLYWCHRLATLNPNGTQLRERHRVLIQTFGRSSRHPTAH